MKTHLFLWVTRGDDTSTGDSLNNYIFKVLNICSYMLMSGFKISEVILFSVCDEM